MHIIKVWTVSVDKTNELVETKLAIVENELNRWNRWDSWKYLITVDNCDLNSKNWIFKWKCFVMQQSQIQLHNALLLFALFKSFNQTHKNSSELVKWFDNTSISSQILDGNLIKFENEMSDFWRHFAHSYFAWKYTNVIEIVTQSERGRKRCSKQRLVCLSHSRICIISLTNRIRYEQWVSAWQHCVRQWRSI